MAEGCICSTRTHPTTLIITSISGLVSLEFKALGLLQNWSHKTTEN